MHGCVWACNLIGLETRVRAVKSSTRIRPAGAGRFVEGVLGPRPPRRTDSRLNQRPGRRRAQSTGLPRPMPGSIPSPPSAVNCYGVDPHEGIAVRVGCTPTARSSRDHQTLHFLARLGRSACAFAGTFVCPLAAAHAPSHAHALWPHPALRRVRALDAIAGRQVLDRS